VDKTGKQQISQTKKIRKLEKS